MLSDDKNLLPLLGLEALPDDEAREALAELHDVIMQAVLFRVMPRLMAGEQEQLLKLAEGKEGGDVVYAFLKEHVHDIDTIVEEEARMARERLAAIMPPLSETEKKFGADIA